MRTPIIVILVVILLGIFGPQTLYTVDETEFAVVTRFGEIQDIHTSPGLKVKTPFIDQVQKLDRRVLRVDMPEATLPDSELQFLVIDAYTRYRIKPDKENIKKFFEKMRTLQAAEDRIGRIVISELRDEVAQRKRQEIIGAREEVDADGERVIISTTTRQEILDRVLEAAKQATSPGGGGDLQAGEEDNDIGVEILDVRMKRADFPEAAIQTIFTRMRTGRELISAGLRAEGSKENAKIRAEVDKQRTIILAEADRDGNIIRGSGDAEAIRIYAGALEQDPEFFEFRRSLEAYRTFLSTNSTVVLSSEADLFKFLQDPQVQPPSDQQAEK